MRLRAESKGASSAYFMKRRFHCKKVEELNAGTRSGHPERSAAESKDPATLPKSNATGFLDFARNDSLAASTLSALTFNGMIDPDLLLQGYRLGVFPMAMNDDSIEWFSPDPRAVLPLDDFHVPHALRRLVRRKPFEITIDKAFSAVIQACAERENTWINRDIIDSYTRLHELGHAHSVEAWKENKLAGGLYGVAVGGAFFGESMFHRVTDASKIALVALVEHLRARKFVLLDTQWLTPHLQQFGGIQISRSHYLRLLRRAVDLPRRFL